VGTIAPNGVLSKSIGKYKINKDFLFRNIKECNNNEEEINKKFEGMDYTDERVAKCVFGMKYVEACAEDYWHDAAPKDLIKQIKIGNECPATWVMHTLQRYCKPNPCKK
jgi:hypothetical protein